jgi:protein involved in sex pheromone biosynthesis
MKYILLALTTSLLLAGCDDNVDGRADTHCKQAELAAAWLQRDVTTRAELQQEIKEVIAPNKCDGITPQKLQKVMLDLSKLSGSQ